MSDKHIDLANQVFAETNTVYLADVKATLRWLDEKPADLPERTITEARMIQACDNLMKSEAVGDYVGGTRRLAIELGFTVVPDPEPTNAELIDRAYELWDMYPQDETFGEYLDRHGWTKAPEAGGGNEQ